MVCKVCFCINKKTCGSRAAETIRFAHLSAIQLYYKYDMRENRKKVIIIRLTEKERNELVSRANSVGKSISSYVREVSLLGNFTTKTDIQTVYELKKIGANINQLVKYVNMLPVDENVRQSLARMNEYLSDIDRIKKNLL